MNVLHTTCPSCHAIFRVRQDQLDAQGGKVRCGKCAYVFNGVETLITPIETVSLMVLPEAEGPASITPADVDAPPRAEHPSDLLGRETDAPIAADEIGAHSSSVAEAQADTMADEESPKTARHGLAMTPELHAKLNDLQQHLSQQEAKRRWRVLRWGIGALFLIVVLAGQSVYYYRDQVAAYFPQYKPLLTQACRIARCRVGLLADIGQIKLDGHELQAMPDHPNVVVFSAWLRNNAGYRLAYPNLELTLTDVANQPLARRQFAPSEYLPRNIKPDQGFPQFDEVPVKLTLELEQLDAVGYKSRVYYP